MVLCRKCAQEALVQALALSETRAHGSVDEFWRVGKGLRGLDNGVAGAESGQAAHSGYARVGDCVCVCGGGGGGGEVFGSAFCVWGCVRACVSGIVCACVCGCL